MEVNLFLTLQKSFYFLTYIMHKSLTKQSTNIKLFALNKAVLFQNKTAYFTLLILKTVCEFVL